MGTKRSLQKGPRKSLIFIALYATPLEQAQDQNVSNVEAAQGKTSKSDSRYRVVQVVCAGIMIVFATIGILAAMFVK
jgi:hypothetical protein